MIAIKGLKMPTSCSACPLSYENDYVERCKINDMRIEENYVDHTLMPVDIYSTRHPRCPLITVNTNPQVGDMKGGVE